MNTNASGRYRVGGTVTVGNASYVIRDVGEGVLRFSRVGNSGEWFETRGLSPDQAVRTLSNIEYKYAYMRRDPLAVEAAA